MTFLYSTLSGPENVPAQDASELLGVARRGNGGGRREAKREKSCRSSYFDLALWKGRECEISRPVTGLTADASTVATATV